MMKWGINSNQGPKNNEKNNEKFGPGSRSCPGSRNSGPNKDPKNEFWEYHQNRERAEKEEKNVSEREEEKKVGAKEKVTEAEKVSETEGENVSVEEENVHENSYKNSFQGWLRVGRTAAKVGMLVSAVGFFAGAAILSIPVVTYEYGLLKGTFTYPPALTSAKIGVQVCRLSFDTFVLCLASLPILSLLDKIGSKVIQLVHNKETENKTGSES